MKTDQKPWTRDELVLAINLYCKLPFGKLHSRNPDITDLASIIGRTPSAVAFKLVNFASFDPTLKERGIKGASNASKLDKIIWDEFFRNWDKLLIESEMLLAKVKHTTIKHLNNIDLPDLSKTGIDKKRFVNTRVNQAIFRKLIMATYNNSCCITGIKNPDLLIASHITPWSLDKKNRLNPINGLCLNALHDKAFDRGLITISAEDYTIKVSTKLKKESSLEFIANNFLAFENKPIILPTRFHPSTEQLKKHNDFFSP